MSDWLIVSKMNPLCQVRVGNCTREHAESVLASLLVSPQHPDDVRLVAADAPPPKKSWFRKVIRFG